MNFPKNYKYTKDHEWIELQGQIAKVGVSAYAIEQLGDIVHIELPKSGTTFKAGESFGTIESTKTVSDLYMPVAGKISEVNQAALQKPELLQEDPYQQGWLVKMTLEKDTSLSGLFESEEYEKYLRESGN